MNTTVPRAGRDPRRAAPRRAQAPLPLVLLGLAGMLLLPGSARSALVQGPGGTAEQGRRLVTAQPVTPPASAPTLVLASGVISAVDAAAQRITLTGRSVPLHPGALRVLSASGQPLPGAAALRPGMAVRFALEPAGPNETDRRIVLIYVDHQP
jgi:hypothetical protein